MNIYEQVARNKRATWTIIAIFVIFFIAIGAGLDYFYGSGTGIPVFGFLAVLISCISSYAGFFYGDKMILASTHARPLDISDPRQKQWQNVVEEMSIASGIPVPKTYLIDDPDPNAFATGRNPNESSIAVTSGLLNTLNREELQGVAAHEISHIRNYDTRLMLVIAVLVGALALIADWSSRMLWYRSGRRNSGRSEGGGVLAFIALAIWLITVILAPLLSQLMAMFVSRRREYLADASGAELTRNPLGLAAALEKLDGEIAPTRSINQGNAHLCIIDPRGRQLNSKEGFAAEIFATHPPIKKRIAALKEMAYSNSHAGL